MKNNPKPLPLNSLYPRLAKNQVIKDELKRTFGEDTPLILKKMIAGTTTKDEDDTIYDNLTELINNDGQENTFYANGSDGCFPITVRGISCCWFIQANEFDDIGYFTSAKSARAYAKIEYQSYGPFVKYPDDEDYDD